MVDTLTKAQRSERMSRIRGRDTKPEVTLRKLLHAQGLRYRLHVATLPGRPDIVLPMHRAVVLVHGCFWHRHGGCKVATTPKTNTAFWSEKFKRNVGRDELNHAALEALGWRVFVVWECELATSAKAEALGRNLARMILEGSPAKSRAGKETPGR